MFPKDNWEDDNAQADQWSHFWDLLSPRRTPYSGDKAVIVSSLNWLTDSNWTDCLIASHLYHGIMCVLLRNLVALLTSWTNSEQLPHHAML